MGVESRYNFQFGYLEHGKRNLITDVPGVRVGHETLHTGDIPVSYTHLDVYKRQRKNSRVTQFNGRSL